MFDSGKVRRWMGDRELARLESGGAMTALDIAAVREGQAEARMRGYARRQRVWDERGGRERGFE